MSLSSRPKQNSRLFHPFRTSSTELKIKKKTSGRKKKEKGRKGKGKGGKGEEEGREENRIVEKVR